MIYIYIVEMDDHLNLLNVDIFEFFFHFLDPHFHGVDSGFGVFKSLGGHVSLLHIKRLISQILHLGFILFFLFQKP